MFETKIQTLTIGNITLIIHTKRYWKYAITTMLWTYELNAFA